MVAERSARLSRLCGAISRRFGLHALLRGKSTPRAPITPGPHGKCSPGRTRNFWDYLLILVGQLGKVRRFRASEHSWALIWLVVARLGSSNVKCLRWVARKNRSIFWNFRGEKKKFRGSSYVACLKFYEASYKNFDLKSRFYFGKVSDPLWR